MQNNNPVEHHDEEQDQDAFGDEVEELLLTTIYGTLARILRPDLIAELEKDGREQSPEAANVISLTALLSEHISQFVYLTEQSNEPTTPSN